MWKAEKMLESGNSNSKTITWRVLCHCYATPVGIDICTAIHAFRKAIGTQNTHSKTLIFPPPMHIGHVHSFWASRIMDSFSSQLKPHNLPHVKHSSSGKFHFLFTFKKIHESDTCRKLSVCARSNVISIYFTLCFF